MKSTRLLFILLGTSMCSFSQSKEELIRISDKDSVIVYAGEGPLSKGNCLFIKFTANAQLFFNDLASFHAHSEKHIQRTQNTLSISPTSKPYWVYGEYSVFAEIIGKVDYQLIVIHFKAYNNPENYKMYDATQAYQKIINRLLIK